MFQEFVTLKSWAHIDMSNVKRNDSGDVAFIGTGFSGQTYFVQ